MELSGSSPKLITNTLQVFSLGMLIPWLDFGAKTSSGDLASALVETKNTSKYIENNSKLLSMLHDREELLTQSVAAYLISLPDLGDSRVDDSWMIPVEMLAYNGYNLKIPKAYFLLAFSTEIA